MSPLAALQQFTQQVYLVVKGRYFDGIPYPDTTVELDDDGITLMQQTMDWTNMFIDELETETDPEGQPLNWSWLRQTDYEIGTATAGSSNITLPGEVNFLLADEQRYVQVTQDGTVVSNFAVVSPSQIASTTNRITEDTCAVTGTGLLTFSRPFHDYEDGGVITGDVSISFPRMAYVIATDGTFTPTNVKILSTVKPKLLLTLGVAKNSSLPDIVQGGLSPSYTQKYGDLLNSAIARNEASSESRDAPREDYGAVGGVY